MTILCMQDFTSKIDEQNKSHTTLTPHFLVQNIKEYTEKKNTSMDI